MKTIFTIIGSLLFFSVFFTPTEEASLTTFVCWFVWVAFALYMSNVIFREVESWRDEDARD